MNFNEPFNSVAHCLIKHGVSLEAYWYEVKQLNVGCYIVKDEVSK